MSNRRKLTEEEKRIFTEKCRKTKLERYGDPTYNKKLIFTLLIILIHLIQKIKMI